MIERIIIARDADEQKLLEEKRDAANRRYMDELNRLGLVRVRVS
jgi:hypothetical protein